MRRKLRMGMVGGGQDAFIASGKWYPLYKRVLDAGKSLFLIGPFSHKSKDIVKQFGKRGIAICYYGDISQEEIDIINVSYDL